MKRPSINLMLALLTFFISVGVVSFWYFSEIDSANEKPFSEITSLVPPVKPIYENPCDYSPPHFRELEAEEAIYRAECFIIQNGYTDLPPLADRSKITPENVFPLTDDEGMKMRHDSLERKAYSYERNDGYGGSWFVMFRFKPRPEIDKRNEGKTFDEIGRAVVMDYYGNQVRIQHSWHPLNTPDTKIINP